MSDSNLFAQQRANRKRSTVLVTVFLLFFAWVGFGGDLAWYLMSADAGPATYHHTIPFVGLLATLAGAGMAVYAWRRGPQEVLWATGAWEMIEPANQRERVLRNVVEEMAIASGLPVPTIWIVPDEDPNAFATGVDERRSHVAVTEGLLQLLDRDQLQAVVAHEMAHIRNHDVKLMTLLAALVGVVTLLSDATHRTARIGARIGGGKVRGSKKSRLGIVLLVLWLVTLLVAPIVSRLMALSVSRNREFLADAMAAQFTRNPSALAKALRAIEDAHTPTIAIGRGSAHLCIADPLGRRVTHKQGKLADLLATHPPMAMRVARLKAMAFQYDQTGVIPEHI